MITVGDAGEQVGNPLYTAWQEGWDAGFWECMATHVAAKAPGKNGDGPNIRVA